MHVFLSILAVIATAVGLWRWNKHRKRQVLLSSHLTEQERTIVADQVPLIRRLPPALRDRLEGKIRLFLHQIEFIGCNGLEVTDEMRLSIAAQAGLLVVNRDDWYEHLRTVLIYPAAFRSRVARQDGYVVTERDSVRLGESWQYGPVVLSWEHSEKSAQDDRDGHNVVLHEFAHQLDSLTGQSDGVPVLNEGQDYGKWAEVFEAAYWRHVGNVEYGRETVIDAYGAENQQEFFAVAIETFFEKPHELRLEAPDVYEQLADLLWLDPVSWEER